MLRRECGDPVRATGGSDPDRDGRIEEAARVEFGVEGDADVRNALVASLVRRAPPPTATVATVSGPARGCSPPIEPRSAGTQ